MSKIHAFVYSSNDNVDISVTDANVGERIYEFVTRVLVPEAVEAGDMELLAEYADTAIKIGKFVKEKKVMDRMSEKIMKDAEDSINLKHLKEIYDEPKGGEVDE